VSFGRAGLDNVPVFLGYLSIVIAIEALGKVAHPGVELVERNFAVVILSFCCRNPSHAGQGESAPPGDQPAKKSMPSPVDGCGAGETRKSIHQPAFLAIFQFIAFEPQRAGQHDFLDALVAPNDRRAETADRIGPGRFPQRLSSSYIQRQQGGVSILVTVEQILFPWIMGDVPDPLIARAYRGLAGDDARVRRHRDRSKPTRTSQNS